MNVVNVQEYKLRTCIFVIIFTLISSTLGHVGHCIGFGPSIIDVDPENGIRYKTLVFYFNMFLEIEGVVANIIARFTRIF